MKTKLQIIDDIKNKLKAPYEKIGSLPNKENTSSNKYSKTWATVVAVNIVEFNKIVLKIDDEYVIKIIQLFNESITSVAKSEKFKDIFRDIYFLGNEVVVVFDGNQKQRVTEAIDFSFYVNSIVNTILSKELIELVPQLNEFNAGIGIWTSNDNMLVINSLKTDQEHLSSTLIGSSIDNASKLAKVAKRGGFKNHNILMNNITKNNAIGSTGKSINKLMSKINYKINDAPFIWGGNIVKTSYK